MGDLINYSNSFSRQQKAKTMLDWEVAVAATIIVTDGRPSLGNCGRLFFVPTCNSVRGGCLLWCSFCLYPSSAAASSVAIPNHRIPWLGGWRTGPLTDWGNEGRRGSSFRSP